MSNRFVRSIRPSPPLEPRRFASVEGVVVWSTILLTSACGGGSGGYTPADRDGAGGDSTPSAPRDGGAADGGGGNTQRDGGGAGVVSSPADGATSGRDSGIAVPAGSWLSGASGNGAVDGTFGRWRGRPIDIGGTWADTSAEEQREVWSVRPGVGEWADFDGPLDIANGGIFPKEGESWGEAATGAYDERWRTSVSNIKAARAGKGLTFIRFAHEFNGDWYWPVTDATADDFKKAWIRFFTITREIFPEAKLSFCPNDGTTVDLDVRNAFPGAEYVDVVCVDSYNWDPAADSTDEFNAKIAMESSIGAPIGLEKWRLFAESKGLPMAIGEWSGSAKQGDHPGYMTEFHKWLAAHAGSGPGQVIYEILFNQWTDFQLWPNTAQPKAAARYNELW
jgi:hypothetical protein